MTENIKIDTIICIHYNIISTLEGFYWIERAGAFVKGKHNSSRSNRTSKRLSVKKSYTRVLLK